MITLHPSASTSFTTQGVGSLRDYVKGVVIEELNGIFELTLQYPVTGAHYKDIQLRKIIYCKPNPYSSPQPFRIYSISKPINRIVTINACHISYDLSDYPVNEFKAVSPQDAMTKLKANAQVSHPFTFNSTVTATGEINVESPRTTRYVLGNNIQTAYPGEFEFDNFMVYHRQNRGMNRGVSIRYGKNLLDINQEESISNVYTGVYPYIVTTERLEDGTDKTTVTKLPEKVVNVQGAFDFTRILPLDMGEFFTNGIPTETQLRDVTLAYITSQKIGIPKVTLELSSVQLPGTVEEMYIGDTVLIEFIEAGIDATARCIKTTYNIATDRYESVTFGEAKSNLATAISDSNKNIANKVEQQKIYFDAEVGNIKIDFAQIELAIIDKANIDWVTANFAHLVDGYIDRAEIKDATIGTAQIEDLAVITAKIKDLAVETAKIQNLAVTNAKIGNLAVDNAKIKDLSAEKITAGDISADRITTNVITAVNANIGSATINSAKIGNLDATKITTGDLAADRIKTNVITAINANLGSVTINSAKIGNLDATKITTGDLAADRIKTNVITAINTYTGTATIESAKIGSLDASKITTGDLTADRIQAQVISAINSYAGTAKIKQAQIDTLVVGTANITDLSVTTAKIADLQITNAKIANATIESAKIKSLDVGKLNAGTIDTTKFTIASTTGKLTISGNTIIIKDAQTVPVTRVQIGLDALGNYGIYVVNAAGVPIFDSAKGVLSADGLSTDVVTTDKILNEAVTPGKIQIDQLWANEGFIANFSATSIDAGQIKTGKISNDVIDIAGLVTFESFSPDMKPVFSVTGGKTYINGGMIATNSITANSIDLLSGLTVKGPDNQNSFAISSNGEIEINGWLHSTNYVAGVSGYSINRDGTAELNEVRVRGTFDAVDAGITNSIDNPNAVRIWAGGSYENRDVAKFRVTKNGDLFATDATLSGVLYGDLVNDNLTIDNGSVIIKEATETVVNISSGLTLLNTDVEIGAGNVRYSKGDKILSLSGADFKVEASQGNILIDRSVGPLGGLNIIGPSGGHHILRGSAVAERLGTLVFDSEGNQGGMGDFSFTRKNYTERCKFHIDGDLNVGEKISSTIYSIEQRWIKTGTNEGIGFYVM